LLNTTKKIDDGEDSRSHDDIRVLLGHSHSVRSLMVNGTRWGMQTWHAKAKGRQQASCAKIRYLGDYAGPAKPFEWRDEWANSWWAVHHVHHLDAVGIQTLVVDQPFRKYQRVR
jgi:hypothetical protein